MILNGVTENQALIPEIWASDLYDELRANNSSLALFFERDYEGEIANLGDTVRVNQIVAPEGELLSNDKDQFNSETMQIDQFSIVANKRAVGSFEFTDLAQLQSQSFMAEAQEALVYSIRKKMENDLISALSANVSTSAPDHDIAPTSASDMAAVDIAAMRTLLSKQFVPNMRRALFLDPQYYGDILDDAKIMSRDYTQGNRSEPGVADSFLGFQIVEHNLLGADVGFAAHPSALQMVMQQEVRVKVSDLHAQSKFGFKLSADMVYGFTVADNKRYVKISG